MRIVIGKARPLEGHFEYFADRSGIAPKLPRQASSHELTAGSHHDRRLGKEGILRPEQFLCSQIAHPISDDGYGLGPDRKKRTRKAFAEFRPHVAGILDQTFLSEIDMLQFQ